jgi:hypothetical protein
MRRRHAAEIASFLKRIDPVLLENQYSEDLMQPLTLSLVEKQQQTQHLLSVLGVPIPNTDQNTDQLIKDLENERKLAQEAIAQRAMELINIKVESLSVWRVFFCDTEVSDIAYPDRVG